ncbi:MAG: protease inhibitor I42 family protein [Chloroflexi bacterium]|nr:protease inhibitor I42 family protein [Chloroflexota bacterium]
MDKVKRIEGNGKAIIVWWVALLLLGACATPTVPASATPTAAATRVPGSASPASASPTPIAVTPIATTIRADVVLTESHHQIATTVKVGQIINVVDFPGYEWNVNYYDQVLLALTLPEKMKKPGASGWFFRVIAAGHTEIVLESIPPPCPGGTPCPPNIVRWVFPIQAVP